MAKTFIKGAAILGAAGVVTKILGFIFRIPLVSMISEDGALAALLEERAEAMEREVAQKDAALRERLETEP